MKRVLLSAVALVAFSAPAIASTFSVTVDGTDAIFLAGREGAPIPDPSLPWGDTSSLTDDGMLRHSRPTPEEAKETVPTFVSVTGGDVVRVLDPAVGGINFFNGSSGGLFGPEGNSSLTSSTITSFGGISGYKGTQGALVGVFLSAANPTGGTAPATLDFSTIGTDFTTLSPLIGQIFFIGDGKTSGGVFHEFVAPTGATRLYFGVPDAFGFNGVPGAYDDNDGSYSIRVGVNQVPTTPAVPLPASAVLLLGALGGLRLLRKRVG
ncbi:MAG: PEP-CTERM sorting domain-containing protein [Pseudomonadota bacterium]